MTRFLLVGFTAALFVIMAVGLFWFFSVGPAAPVGLGWYFFSFASGLTMIVLACTFPLVFVIVPLSLGKGPVKGVAIALMFSLGVVTTLSLYGIIAAVAGKVALGAVGAPLETVKNWLYFIAGSFAYLFALGEIGLINFRMPTYTGAAPAAIQKQHDYFKALLLGLFLGNIGVGCPHPATPVILTRIAAAGDIFYGWSLFFIHAVGRVLPLLFVAFLGILGVNALTWLVARKERIERATGWAMVFAAGFILVLGLFSHDWWVYSGQHTFFEAVTQEETVLGFISQRLGVEAPHAHGIPTGTGLFGLPLWLGNWILIGLWVLPLWVYYIRQRAVPGEPTRMRFWFTVVFSLFLAVMFIHVFPDQFLFHRQSGLGTEVHRDEETMMEEHGGGEGMVMTEEHGGEKEMTMMGNGHAVNLIHEENDVQQGVVTNSFVNPPYSAAATTTTLSFYVNEKPWNVPVTDLEIEHERVMHVVGVRDDLQQFLHIHPAPAGSPGWFTVNHIFAQPGVYKFWSQVKVKRDSTIHTFGHPLLTVGAPLFSSPPQVSFERSVTVGGYRVVLTVTEPVSRRQTATLIVGVHTAAGREVPLEDLLGSPMHLAIFKDDLTYFKHTHPESPRHAGFNFSPVASAHGPEEKTGSPPAGLVSSDSLSFPIVFPASGLYKIFVQFRPAGIGLPPEEALKASFWLKVVDQPPAYFSPARGGGLGNPIPLAVSIAAIALLGWTVNRYIRHE